MTRRQSVIALLFAVVGVLIGTAMPASASTGAGGFTILSAADGQSVHHCEVIGSADGYQAVICTDINTGWVAGTEDEEYYFKGAIEVYCQTDSGVTVRCANIYAEGAYANGDGSVDDVGSYACGHSYGACPSDRKVITEGEFTDDIGNYPNCYLYTALDDVWSVVYGGNTQIELPVSDKTVELDASNGGNDGINYSSGHYLVCPYNPE